MKVAYISSSVFTDCDLPLISEMISHGIDVTYYLMMSDDNKQGTLVNVDNIKPEARVYPGKEYATLSNLSRYIDIDRVRVANMPVAHDYSFKTFLLAHRLKKELKKESYDLIHITWHLQYSFFELYMLKIPFVITLHDPLPHSSNETFLQNFHRSVALKKAKKIILLNKTQKEDFKKRYKIGDERISFSRLSIYKHLLDTKNSKQIIDGRYILYFGSINSHKGIKYICEAMKEINLSFQDVKLVIAGRGTFDFDINEYVKNHNVKCINRFVTNDELVSLIKGSEFVCCPYIDATQSGVIMSAFALDKPVLATRVGALNEMLEDKRHGLLVEPKDSNALAKASINMLTDNVIDEMSHNIHKDFSDGVKSWKMIAEGMIGIYNDVIK